MSNGIVIQKVEKKEIPKVVELVMDISDSGEVRVFKYLESRINSDRHLLLLAISNKEPVGLLECSIRQLNTLLGSVKQGVLSTIYIKQSYRRQGIAGKLLKTAGYWFGVSDAEMIFCDVLEVEEDLAAFLKSSEFEVKSLKYQRKNVPLG